MYLKIRVVSEGWIQVAQDRVSGGYVWTW